MKVFEVVVKPNSRKTEITSDDGILKVNVKGKAENGEANLELTRFMSKIYKGNAEIIRGRTSRKKLVKISP